MPFCENAHPDGQGRDANASPPTTSASPSRCPSVYNRNLRAALSPERVPGQNRTVHSPLIDSAKQKKS